MKTTISLLGGVLMACAHAQESPPGFIRLVNAAAGGDGNLVLSIDGEAVYAKGYKLGQTSGGIGLAAGRHRIELRKDGMKPLNETVELKAGSTVSLVVFTEKEESPPYAWRLRLMQMTAQEASGYRLCCLSLCRREELSLAASVDGKKPLSLPLQRGAAASLALGGQRGRVSVKVAGLAAADIDLDDPGNYMLVIFDDANGQVRCLSYYDPVFSRAG